MPRVTGVGYPCLSFLGSFGEKNVEVVGYLSDTLHSTLHTPLYTLNSLCTLHIPHSTLYTPHFTLYTPHSPFHTLHSTLHTSHSTLSTPHSPLHTSHSTLYTPHFALYTQHSTLYTPHSTSTFDSASPYIGVLYVICIRVRWFLLFFTAATAEV